MADRVLIWHIPDVPYPPSVPAYYLDADYTKGAVRIFAETAPYGKDLKIDILADGVSIFNDSSSWDAGDANKGWTVPRLPDTSVSLLQGENYEENAADFTNESLDEGTWMRLSVVDLAGAKNVTVQLELNKLSDEEKSEEE
jgi:hypothetical protein